MLAQAELESILGGGAVSDLIIKIEDLKKDYARRGDGARGTR